jgi:hypothetical protein
LQRRRARQQIELLEDKTDLAIADLGQLIVVQRVHVHPGELVQAGRRLIQATDDVHQGRFAGTAGPHDGGQIAFVDGQCRTAQGMHFGLAHLVDLADVFNFDDRLSFHKSITC